MQLKQASDHTLLVQRRYSRCIEPNYNSKDAVSIFHDSLSYYQHTNSCLYSTVRSRFISMWTSRAFLVRIFFPCGWHKISNSIQPIDFKFGIDLQYISLYHPYLEHCQLLLLLFQKKFLTLKKVGRTIEFFLDSRHLKLLFFWHLLSILIDQQKLVLFLFQMIGSFGIMSTALTLFFTVIFRGP